MFVIRRRAPLAASACVTATGSHAMSSNLAPCYGSNCVDHPIEYCSSHLTAAGFVAASGSILDLNTRVETGIAGFGHTGEESQSLGMPCNLYS